LDIKKSNKQLNLDITKEPFIEFEYKGILYSMEITRQNSSFKCIIKENIKPTLILKKNKEL